MNKKEQQIIEPVYQKFIKYWDEYAVILYVPKLFPFVEPEEKVRDAMKAFNCKNDKDKRFWIIERASRRLIETDREAQKSNVSVTLDINQLIHTIYGECEKCPIREICKEAFAIVTEYVSDALRQLDFQIPAKEK